MGNEELKPGSEELKPCPFCGGEAEIVRVEEDLNIYLEHFTSENLDKLYARFYVRCTDKECGCMTKRYYTVVGISEEGSVLVMRNGAKSAIDAWNRRAGDDE